MRAYTFNDYMRDCRHIGKIPWSMRLIAWFQGSSLEKLDEMGVSLAQFSNVVNTIGVAMTAAERANPRTLLESRRMEIADAANITDQMLSGILEGFDRFSESGRRRWPLSWEMLLIDALFFGLPLVLLGLLVGMALLIWNTAF